MILRHLLFVAQTMKPKVKKFFTKEDGAVDIVAIVVLMGIVVLLALAFKTQIEGLLESLFGTISDNAVDAVGGSASE